MIVRRLFVMGLICAGLLAAAGGSARAAPRSSVNASLVYTNYFYYNFTNGSFCTRDGQLTVAIVENTGTATGDAATVIYPQAHAQLTNGSGGQYNLRAGNALVQAGCYAVAVVTDSDYTAGNNIIITVWFNGQAAVATPTPFVPAYTTSQTGDTSMGQTPRATLAPAPPPATLTPSPVVALRVTPRPAQTCPPGSRTLTEATTSQGTTVTCEYTSRPIATQSPSPTQSSRVSTSSVAVPYPTSSPIPEVVASAMPFTSVAVQAVQQAPNASLGTKTTVLGGGLLLDVLSKLVSANASSSSETLQDSPDMNKLAQQQLTAFQIGEVDHAMFSPALNKFYTDEKVSEKFGPVKGLGDPQRVVFVRAMASADNTGTPLYVYKIYWPSAVYMLDISVGSNGKIRVFALGPCTSNC